MLERNDSMTFDEKWRSLTITNDFIFGWVFSDKERCKKLIELLLGIKVRNLEVPQTQKSVRTSFLSRGVPRAYLKELKKQSWRMPGR